MKEDLFQNQILEANDKGVDDLFDEVEKLLERHDLPRGGKYDEWRKRVDKDDLGKEDLIAIILEINNVFRALADNRNKPFRGLGRKDGFIEKSLSNLREEIKIVSVEKIKIVVKEALNKKMEMLGEGMSAQVFFSKKYPEYCYKIIVNSVVYGKDCSVQEEADFLCEMANLNVDGVRVPRPFYYHMDDEVHMYVMENLNAVTLADIKAGKAILPKNMDVEKVIADLRTFFKEMHEKIKLYHRDFHDGNLMIDSNGTPCIIDPGKAKKRSFDNEEMYRSINYNLGTRDIYIDDLRELEEHIRVIRKLHK